MEIINLNYKEFLKTESPIIFDVGSHDGTDALKYFEQFNSPKLHCFEPQNDMFELLEKKLLGVKNGEYHLNNVAVSNRKGFSQFNVADNTMSGSLKEPKQHLNAFPTVLFTKMIIVKTITLDDYSLDNKIDYCDLLYMDVQGAEDLVFEGAKNFLEKVRYIFTEFSYIELYDKALNIQGICNMLPNFNPVMSFQEHPTFGMLLLKNKKEE